MGLLKKYISKRISANQTQYKCFFGFGKRRIERIYVYIGFAIL